MPLNIQKYLRRTGNSPETLKEALGIKSYKHPDFPLVGFKYNQIESPKTHKIVREARGIVLDSSNNWNLAAKGFDRFFNVGEVEEEYKRFNWKNFICTTKEDGSLILLYYYSGEWHVNTSGSFGLSSPEGYDGTWQDLFWEYSGDLRGKLLHMARTVTLIFELCTPVNKVVRRYEEPGIFLIGANSIHQHQDVSEYGYYDVVDLSRTLGCRMVDSHAFRGKDQLKEWLLQREEEDPTFEGVVIRDIHGLRYKWKTKSYVALHRLFDNGNVILPKNLVSIVMGGEYSEVSTSLPEVKPALDEVSEIIDKAFADLAEVWLSNKDLESQKDFAMKVKDHPFFYILFKARKKLGSKGTAEDLKKIWREGDNHSKIAKRLFANKKFEFARPKLHGVASG